MESALVQALPCAIRRFVQLRYPSNATKKKAGKEKGRGDAPAFRETRRNAVSYCRKPASFAEVV